MLGMPCPPISCRKREMGGVRGFSQHCIKLLKTGKIEELAVRGTWQS
jgi:hypothetical protein